MTRPCAAASLTAALVAALVAMAGCMNATSHEATPAPARTEPPELYVAIGSDETLGTGLEQPLVDAWPRRLYRTVFGPGAVFVNAATGHSTVGEALHEQLPLALDLEPAVVTVWLNVDDLQAGTPADRYEHQLTQLVRTLRRAGSQVLLANLPAPALGPAALLADDEIAGRVAAYNTAIARVAAAEGATLVDLHAATADEGEGGGWSTPLATDPSGHLTAPGHAYVAELFARAFRAGSR